MLGLRLLLEIAVIVLGCRLTAACVRRLGQPAVVGEMIAGVVLGPSVFGAFLPAVQTVVFPAELKPALYWLSQAGLAIYMFAQGVEFDFRIISRKNAFFVSLAGILAPLAVGAGLGWLMCRAGGFFGEGIPAWQGALFLGAAMSITAFPVLARIIEERGLRGTTVGTLAFAAGAIGDLVAWLLFALVIACLKEGSALAFLRSNLVFCAFLFGALARKAGIGIPAHLYSVASRILVPVFFACSGFNTKLPLLSSLSVWGMTLTVLLAASVSKGGACATAARRAGFDSRGALALGALMNSRGLMELILLDIGLGTGLITPTLFTILALMAILTTFAATPTFELVWRKPAALATPGEIAST